MYIHLMPPLNTLSKFEISLLPRVVVFCAAVVYNMFGEMSEKCLSSLAVSRPSRDTIIAGRQAATVLFWETERTKYDLYVSQYVIDECALGDVDAAKRRLDFLNGIPIIPESGEISALAVIYQRMLGIPDRARIDCYHLAACVIAGIDYLLSWNCTHLGIQTFVRIQKHNERNGLFTPLLLTPEALMDSAETEE